MTIRLHLLGSSFLGVCKDMIVSGEDSIVN